jgi:hypothetical protein
MVYSMSMERPVEIHRFELEATAMDALRHGDLTRAREVAETLLPLVWEDSVEDAVIRRSLLRLVGRDEPVIVPVLAAPWTERAFCQIAQGWCFWADREFAAAKEAIQIAHTPEPERMTTPLTHRMALYQWVGAIDLLLAGHREASGGMWRSAIDFNGHFGLPYLPAIQWSYLVSF